MSKSSKSAGRYAWENTLSLASVSITFGVSRREHAIKADLQPRLWSYIGGIVRNIGMVLYAVGGFEDHVHVFVGVPPTSTISEIAQKIKANASRWMHEEGGDPGFAWQDGYGAFSVSVSHTDTTIAYINHQVEHHKRSGYGDELARILRRHKIKAANS